MSVKTDYATNSFGEQVPTFTVQHAVQSRQRLSISITNTSQADITSVPIFAGIQGKALFDDKKCGDAAGQGVDIVFKVDGFATIAEFAKYFEHARVAIEGAKMYSSAVENFSGEFEHKEKYAFGRDAKEAFQPLEGYRMNTGNGYANDIRIPAKELVWRLWYGLTISLSKLKAGSTVKIDFDLAAQDKTGVMTPLHVASIR